VTLVACTQSSISVSCVRVCVSVSLCVRLLGTHKLIHDSALLFATDEALPLQ
jgi:hypothetical protein